VRRFTSTAWALAAVAWALVIWWLLTLEAIPVPTSDGHWLPTIFEHGYDKAGHAAIFFVQAYLCARAAEPRLGLRRALLLAVAFSVVFGAATELRQRAIPTRDADPADLAADVAGALVAAAAMPLSRRWSRARALARA